MRGVPYVIFVLFLVFVNLCQNKNLQGDHFYVYHEERLDIYGQLIEKSIHINVLRMHAFIRSTGPKQWARQCRNFAVIFRCFETLVY